MKCIYCGSDTKYRDRRTNGGACATCKHPFAFEPMAVGPGGVKLTDGLFQALIRKVSGDGKVFFTERQIWYEFNRRFSRRRFWWGPWGRVAAASGLCGGLAACGMAVLFPPAIPVAVALGAGGAGFAAFRSSQLARGAPIYARIPFGDFAASYLRKWTHTHGPIDHLLPPASKQPDAPPRQMDPDLTAYSFDRALVADHAETAAMLVANNFHFENNCAILSADGYPYGIAQTVLTMLRRNPQLQVFALHDTTPSGCQLPALLREAAWFPDPAIRIIDQGLRPAHAQKLRLLLEHSEPHPLPAGARASLTAAEIGWLEQGNRAELADLRPARLMRALYQGFARANQAGQTDSWTTDAGDTGGGIWIYDSSADIYAADSFG